MDPVREVSPFEYIPSPEIIPLPDPDLGIDMDELILSLPIPINIQQTVGNKN